VPSPLRRLLIGGLLASVASALLPWSEAIADDAKTLRIGYQKFNSINILKAAAPGKGPGTARREGQLA
jgi:sulfonate transport system substrate-binding protein